MKLHFFTACAVLLILLCAGTCALAVDASSAQALTTQERDSLINKIKPAYEKADRGSHWWSVAFHGCVFLAAGASAAAALILKLDRFKDNPSRNDIAACLAAFAALLPLISASGNFSQKWTTNRATRAALSDLMLDIDLAAENANPASNDFARRYKDIMAQHERGIAPGSERTTSTPKSQKVQ
jgi:hypothetical protein